MPRLLRPFSTFRAADHIGDPAATIRANIERFCQAQGVDVTGHRLVMLANARVLGHTFDPLSVFWAIAPDGSQKERAVEFSRGSAKKVAANMTEVHKATLSVLNEYTRAGWHVVSVAPSGFDGTGTTFFSQNVYVLEKR